VKASAGDALSADYIQIRRYVGFRQYLEAMAEPSQYELEAWSDIQAFKGRQVSLRMGEVGQRVFNTTTAAGSRATKYLENHPRAQTALERGQGAAAKGTQIVSVGARTASAALPGWASTAGSSVGRTTGRVSRAGLSPKRVVAKHVKRGHDVSRLRDLRRLDLLQIDAVRGRTASWLYPAGAALSGAGAGFVISGGELVTAVSGGAAAAPSGAAITGAFIGDAATVLALGSRAVGRTALLYGYDPELPAERVFIMSVVNAGSAVSSGAKTAAMADISKLTQALVRDKTWKVLNESVVAKVAQEFAKRFSFRLTKQGLGKVVPAAGIVIGGALNWATLEGIVDAADIAYRRRFLLEKYPHLGDGDTFGRVAQVLGDIADDADTEISVIDQVAEAGGPIFE
jgi:hypothetical protein